MGEDNNVVCIGTTYTLAIPFLEGEQFGGRQWRLKSASPLPALMEVNDLRRPFLKIDPRCRHTHTDMSMLCQL